MERLFGRLNGMARRRLLVLVAALATSAATLVVPPPTAGAATTNSSPAPEFAAHPTITAPPFISVRLGVDPTGPQDFTYTGCKGTDGTACGTFTLDDDDDPTAATARTADGLTPGLYVITQDPVPNWTVTGINCTNTSTEVVDLANRRVTVDLQAGQGVFCTFSNRTQNIRIRQDTSPDDPTDFAYTGCAGASACGGFVLDDDTDGAHRNLQVGSLLRPGTYTVTQSGDDRWPLTALTCDRPETVSLVDRRVTIELTAAETVTCTFTNRTQSITIEQDTQPDGAQDVGFLGCIGSACGPTTLDDDADPALPRTTTARGLAPGTYTVTQDQVPGHDLRALECNTAETVDLGHRRVTITLEPLEDVWCTFRDRQRLTGAVQISAGVRRTCVVVVGGEVRCWGVGPLGDGRQDGGTTPVVVTNEDGTGPLTGVTAVSTSGTFSCAVLTSGQARCWGINHQGQLGNGTTTDALRPTPVLNPEGTGPLSGITEISSGFARSCARLNSGEARCWGYNQDGMIGNGVVGPDALLPVVVLDEAGEAPLSGVAGVSAGLLHTCASLLDGQARCWGRAGLGHGSTTGSPLPVAVSNVDGTGPLNDVTQLTTLWDHTCARLASAEAVCWGSGEGLGSAGPAPRPVSILGPGAGTTLPGVGSISAGGYVTCVTTSQLLCLGRNYYGSVGDGTTTDRPELVPVLAPSGVGPLADVATVSVGYDHACALLQSGEARCWGTNSAGQLGDGTTTPRPLAGSVVAPATP